MRSALCTPPIVPVTVFALAPAIRSSCSSGTMTESPFLDKNELFEDVYKDMPPHLVAQREQLRALEEE